MLLGVCRYEVHPHPRCHWRCHRRHHAVHSLGFRMIAESSSSGAAAALSSAGLVPFKTSVNGLMVNLSAPSVAERRVKRLKRSVWASGHLHGLAEKGFRPSKAWFVTLTYAHADQWAPRHIADAINSFRRFCKRISVPCRYTWVGEIQPGRAARTGDHVVHYHLLAWFPVGVSMPHWDRSTSKRGAFWTHGMSNTEIAFSGVGYLMKYLSKLGELTKFPKGLRLYGIGGLDDTGRAVRTWYNLPEWCKRSFGVGEICRSAWGLLVRATGEILAPMYSVSRMPSGLVLHPLRPIPERFHDGAYSTLRIL